MVALSLDALLPAPAAVTKIHKKALGGIRKGLFKTSSYEMRMVGAKTLRSSLRNLINCNCYDSLIYKDIPRITI